MERSLQRLDRFLPRQHLRDPQRRHQARMLLGICGVLAAVHVAYALAALLLDDPMWWVSLPVWVVVYGGPLLLLWVSQSIQVPANAMSALACTVLLGLGYATGGAQAQVLVLLPLVPLLTVALSGLRAGLVWTSYSALGVVGMMLAPPAEVLIPVSPSLHGGPLIIGLGAALGLMWMYTRGRDEIEGQLRAATAARTRFLAMMSHELRTPMNGVLGMAQLLDETALTEEQREYVRLLRASGVSLLEVLNDVLDFARLEAGRVELASIPLDVGALIRQLSRLVGPQAAEKGLEQHVTIDDSVPRWISGDPARLRQVVLNLLSNAVKFTERGRVSTSATVTPGGLLEICVEDTGIGISPAQQARLFEPFIQASTDTTRRFGGTGLGLTISRQLVEQMSGEVQVRSALGVGSRFTIRLPLKQATPPALPPPRPSPRGDLAGWRVLLAEDNPINQRLMTRLLEKMGATVTLAPDGAAAVRCWRPGRFDLILMDIEMPELDGIAATRAIRAAEQGPERMPIVALTANADVYDVCAEAGIDAILSKPLVKETLIERLRSLSQPARQTSAS